MGFPGSELVSPALQVYSLPTKLKGKPTVVKNPPANARDMGSIPGQGRFPGEGNGYTLQYSCLGNLMDRGVGGLQSLGL